MYIEAGKSFVFMFCKARMMTYFFLKLLVINEMQDVGFLLFVICSSIDIHIEASTSLYFNLNSRHY